MQETSLQGSIMAFYSMKRTQYSLTKPLIHDGCDKVPSRKGKAMANLRAAICFHINKFSVFCYSACITFLEIHIDSSTQTVGYCKPLKPIYCCSQS